MSVSVSCEDTLFPKAIDKLFSCVLLRSASSDCPTGLSRIEELHRNPVAGLDCEPKLSRKNNAVRANNAEELRIIVRTMSTFRSYRRYQLPLILQGSFGAKTLWMSMFPLTGSSNGYIVGESRECQLKLADEFPDPNRS